MHDEGLERLRSDQGLPVIMPHGIAETPHGLYFSFCMHAAARRELEKHMSGTAAQVPIASIVFAKCFTLMALNLHGRVCQSTDASMQLEAQKVLHLHFCHASPSSMKLQ